MAEALGLAANILAVAAFGLQSAKLVHNVLSSLCNSREEFKRTERSLETLGTLLNRIHVLAEHVQPASSASSTPSSNQPSRANNEFLTELSRAVQRCVDDLEPWKVKVEKWAKKAGKESLPGRMVEATKMYIRDRDLRDIHGLVSRHIEQLNVHLSLGNYHQTLEQKKSNQAIISRVDLHGDTLLDQMQASTLDLKSHAVAQHDHLKTITTQNSTRLTAKLDYLGTISASNAQIMSRNFQDMGENSSKMHSHMQNTVETLQQLTQSGFGTANFKFEQMLEMLNGIQSRLPGQPAENRDEDMNDRLQDCIDRLYEIHEQRKGDLYLESIEAQEVVEDVVEILKSLLREVIVVEHQTGSKKRKDRVYEIGELETQINPQERRTLKRMRGILDSVQSTTIQDMNWQKELIPTGRRLETRNRHLELPTGSFSFTTVLVKPNKLQLGPLGREEDVTETFAGSFTLLPRTKKRRMKIRAFLVQNVIKNGAFSISPTLSFHALIPWGSEVHKYIQTSNLERLIELFEKGLASLSDCDPLGRSLLEHAINARASLDIHKYLISKGADVNSLEYWAHSSAGTMQVFLCYCFRHIFKSVPTFNWWYIRSYRPLLLHRNLYNQSTDRDASIVKLLLEAGADPSLGSTNNTHEDFIHMVVDSGSLPALQLALINGDYLLDLETNNQFGQTALLAALSNGFRPTPVERMTGCLSNKISFQQVSLLLRHGANCNAKDSHGGNTLHYVLHRSIGSEEHAQVYYCPHNLSQDLIILLIKGGADVYARNVDDKTPSHFARHGGNKRSWQRALLICGKDPQDVYEKSGLKWTELSEATEEDELAEILEIQWPTRDGKPWPYWSVGTLQKFLIRGIKAGADVYRRIRPGETVSHCARKNRRDRLWSLALESCGYNPKEVYEKSGVEWREARVPIISSFAFGLPMDQDEDEAQRDTSDGWWNIEDYISELEDWDRGDSYQDNDENEKHNLGSLNQAQHEIADYQLDIELNPWDSDHPTASSIMSYHINQGVLDGGGIMEIEDETAVWNLS